MKWPNTKFYTKKLPSGATFTRNHATYDPAGNAKAVNVPRFENRPVYYCGRPVWTSTGLDVSSGANPRLMAAGVSHDNQTPIVVASSPIEGAVKIYSGVPLAFVRTVTTSNLQSTLPAPSGHTYVVASAVVHSGLIILVLERKESGTIKGVTFVASQDLGATWNYIQCRDQNGVRIVASASVSIGDAPTIGTNYATSLHNIWASASFPVNGIHDRLGMWLAWADYQNQDGDPGGGQLGMMRATRTTPTGTWVLEDNRVVYQEENPSDTGLHAHAAAPCSVGLIGSWGDVSYRNRFTLHEIDHATYETATVTHRLSWHGAFDPNGVISSHSPQPVSATPSADGGSFWSGDEDHGTIFKLADVTDPNALPQLSIIDRFAEYTKEGIAFAGIAPLHLRWCNGVNQCWTSGSGNDPEFGLSRDGVGFARMSIAGSPVGGRIHSDGTRMYALDSAGNGVIYVANIPVIRKCYPLKISPGGTNHYDANYITIGPGAPAAIGGTNTKRNIYIDGGVYKYVDNNQAVSPQPPQPLNPNMPIYEIKFVDHISAGWWTHNASGATQDFSGPYTWLYAIYPLEARSPVVELFTRTLTTGFASHRQLLWKVSDSSRWTVWALDHPSVERTAARPSSSFSSRSNGLLQPDRYLIQPLGMTSGLKITYPIAPLTLSATPNEVLQQTMSPVDQTWSAAILLTLDDMRTAEVSTDEPLATVYADANNHVYVRHNSTNGRIEAVVTSAGSTVGTIQLSTGRMNRNDPLSVVISSDGTNILAAACSPRGTASGSIAAQLATLPVRIHTGTPDQTGVVAYALAATAWNDASAAVGEIQTDCESLAYTTAKTTGRLGVTL